MRFLQSISILLFQYNDFIKLLDLYELSDIVDFIEVCGRGMENVTMTVAGHHLIIDIDLTKFTNTSTMGVVAQTQRHIKVLDGDSQFFLRLLVFKMLNVKAIGMR